VARDRTLKQARREARKEARLISDARERGREARARGAPRESCPFGSYHGAPIRAAWLEGWNAGELPTVSELPTESSSPQVTDTPASSPPDAPAPRALNADIVKWPSDKPLPSHYERQRLPCPSCRAVRSASAGQAVVATRIGEGVARLRCRLCGHTFKLPVLQR